MKHLYLILTSFLITFSAASQVTIEQHVSGPSICDGVASISPADYSDSLYDWVWRDDNALPVQMDGYIFDSLCAGHYQFNYGPAGGQIIDTIHFFVDDITGMTIYLNIGVAHDINGDCTGSAQIGAITGTAPYVYSWGQGVNSTTSSATGLCPGIYDVTVTDANGGWGMNDYIILGDGFVFNPEGPTVPNPDDTLSGDLTENCEIDYSAIDSIQLNALVNADSTVIIHWTVFQTDGSITNVYDTLNYSGTGGIYVIEATYYCPFKSTEGFAGFSGQVTLPAAAELGTDELTAADLTAYPNPFNDVIDIRLSRSGNYSVCLCDASGRILQEASFANADSFSFPVSSAVSAGTYLLKITDGKNTVVKLMVK